MLSQLSICAFLQSEDLIRFFNRSLSSDRFILTNKQSSEDILTYLKSKANSTDCLLLEDFANLKELINDFNHHKILLPAVVILNTFSLESDPEVFNLASEALPDPALALDKFVSRYHSAEVQIFTEYLFDHLPHHMHGSTDQKRASDLSSRIEAIFDKAIVQFLQLSPLSSLPSAVLSSTSESVLHTRALRHQQHRLADKLNERLGYLCVYYKRDPQQFLRHLSRSAAQELLKNLKDIYRYIILEYFSSSEELNTKIDEFVNLAFFADMPVTRIVEIHMELMDEFSQQLRLESRSEDILLDYRLVLIDIIAHLCELYRRSIPRDS